MKNFLLLLMYVMPLGLLAQGNVKDLKACIDYGIENSYKVKQAKLDIENNEYFMRENLGVAFPQISGNLNYQRNFGLPTRILTGEFPGLPEQSVAIRFGTDNFMTMGLSLDQVVYNQSLYTSIKLKSVSRQLYTQLLQRSEEEIIFDIAQQYYGILKNEEQKEVLEVNIERLEKLKKLIELQYENDFAKKTDVQKIEVKIADLKLNEIQLEQAIETQYQALKLLMGMPLDQALKIAAMNPSQASDVAGSQFDPNALMNMKLLETQKQLKEGELKITKHTAIPTFGIFGYLGAQFQDNEFNFSENANWDQFSYLGAKLNVPIYDGKARRSKVQQQEVQLKKIEEDKAQASAFAQFEYEMALSKINMQRELLSNKEQNIKLLETLYEQTLLQYKESYATLLDLLNTEADLRQAKIEYNLLLFDMQVLLLEKLKAEGQLKMLKGN